MRRALPLLCVLGMLTSCAVAPTNDAADVINKIEVKRLQNPIQQRNVYFLDQLKLKPRPREVRLSNDQKIVAAALIGTLRKGKVAGDPPSLDNQFNKSWKLEVVRYENRTLTVNISGGREIAKNADALCQVLYTLVDGRVIKDVQFVDGAQPVKEVRSADEESFVAGDVPFDRSTCSTLDPTKTFQLLFESGNKLKYKDVEAFNYNASDESIVQVRALLGELGGDVALVKADLKQSSGPTGDTLYYISLNENFEKKLSARQQAIVLTRVLDAVGQVIVNPGAVNVVVGGVRKQRVAGPAGPVPTPIQISSYRSLMPAEDAAADLTEG